MQRREREAQSYVEVLFLETRYSSDYFYRISDVLPWEKKRLALKIATSGGLY